MLDNPYVFFFFGLKDPLIFVFYFLCGLIYFCFIKSEAKASVKKINYHKFASSADKNSNSPKRYNVAKACSDEVIEAIEEAFLLADKLKQAEVTAIHLFRVLLKKKEVQALFIRLNVNAKKLVELLDRQLINPADKFSGRSQLSSSLEEVLILSFIEAFNLEQDNIKIIDLIPFCYERDPRLAEILYELEVDADKLMNTVEWFRVNQIMLDNYNNYRRLAILKPGTGMDRAYTAIATPTLDHFSHDLTIQSKYDLNEICVGRKKKLELFLKLLLGHSGVL